MLKKILATLLLAQLSSWAVADDINSVPDPLTLDYVLQISESADPNFMRQQARVELALAEGKLVNAQDSFELNLQGRYAKREYQKEVQSHHLAAIHLGVPLFDFGKTSNSRQAWKLTNQAQEATLESYKDIYKTKLMQAYFNVLLADLKYRVDNEAMAIAYVDLDNLQEEHELNRVNDIDLYELEVVYQKAFLQRQRSQANLRQSRMLLANLMGKPNATINKVSMPKLPPLPAELLSIEEYLQIALDNNPRLASAYKSLEAAGYRVKQQKASLMPTIRADAWAGRLSSHPELREGRWHAELSINMPLYDSGVTKSKVSRERAKLQESQADLQEIELEVREQVTKLFFELGLLNVEKQLVDASQNFADYNLDYKRALYENEMQADLGDAMVYVTQADYDLLAYDLKKALLWQQLLIATGRDDLASYQLKQDKE